MEQQQQQQAGGGAGTSAAAAAATAAEAAAAAAPPLEAPGPDASTDAVMSYLGGLIQRGASDGQAEGHVVSGRSVWTSTAFVA